MRKLLYLFIFVIVVFPPTRTKAQSAENEKSAIKKVIMSAYVDGLHNKGDLKATKKGFHPGFDLLIMRNNKLEKLPIYNWLASAKERKAKDPSPIKETDKTKCKFLNIDVTGNVAVAKIELSKHGKPIFIDYLSMYKFKQGWRIVGKVYYRLPK